MSAGTDHSTHHATHKQAQEQDRQTRNFPEHLYPFQSHFLTLQHNQDSLQYHYIDEGPHIEVGEKKSPSGQTFVMFHGNPTWSFYFRNLVIGLRKQYRCVVPDHIGCGFSDKPQNYPYTLEQHIENAEKLLNHLNLTDVTLILHDWGGAIGMGVAAKNPKRIRRIVVLNTAAFPSKNIPFRINICKLPLFGDLAIRGLNGFAGAAIYMAVNDRKRMTRDVVKGLLFPYNSWKNRIATLRFVQDIPMSPKHPTWATLQAVEEGLLNFTSTPILICWGMKDWCFNESFLKTWIEKFPNAEIVRLKDAGHYVLEDAHEQILPKISEFMSRTAPRSLKA